MDPHITWREGQATAEEAIAEYVRAATVETVAELRKQAREMLARADELESGVDRGGAQRFWSWPFYDTLEGGVYMARPGAWLGSCERAAQHLATATGQPVRFSHNERVREVAP